MRTIIAGSRTSTRDQVYEALEKCPWTNDITIVVCGLARGADFYGAQWAREHGLAVHEFPAHWSVFGPSAGPRRNQQMAENADALIAVWDGQSKGTKNMIDIAKRRGLKVHVHHT